MMRAEIALLPCPFCGEQPKVLRSSGEIVCSGHDCFGPVTTAGNLEDATVQWNKRARSPLGEPTEGMEQRAAELVDMCRASRLGVTQANINYNFDNSREQCIMIVSQALRTSGADGWQDIGTAPRTRGEHKGESDIDLWHKGQGRVADCFWSTDDLPSNKSAWFSRSGGRAFNMGTDEAFSHWMPKPATPPAILEEKKEGKS